MAKFLKQAVTGDYFLHNDILAQRPDMFPAEAHEVPVEFGGTLEPPKKAKKADPEKGANEPKAD